MTMKGDYPKENVLTYTISRNNGFNGKLHFRIPAWMNASEVAVEINGNKASLNDLESGLPYLTSSWKAGDVITLTLPVVLRYEASEEPDVAAVFFGPYLLSPNLGRAGNDYTSDCWIQTVTQSPYDFPHFVGSKEDLSSWLIRSGDELQFKGNSTSKTYTFIPFYQCNHMATSIYQRFIGAEDDSTSVLYVPDKLLIGHDVSHELTGRSTIHSIYNRYYLTVGAKNKIQCTMALSPEKDMQHYVMLKYDGWETDTLGNFSVFVDDVYIGEAGPCEKSQQFTFPTVYFKIPLELTSGKSSVKVKLQQGSRAMNYFAIELVTERYLQEICPESKNLYGKEAKAMRLEAEAAQPHESNRTFDGKSSAGAYVSRLATYLQWNTLYIPASQDYDLVICRRGSTALKYNIKVGNASTEVKIPASSGEWNEYSLRIHLDEGFNTLNISPVSVRSPFDIDYVDIIPVDPTSNKSPIVSDTPFYVFPNPATDIVHFKVGDEREGEIRIFDSQGKLCAKMKYPEHTSYDVSVLAGGMYEVLLLSGKNTLSTKLIVNK